MKCSKTFASAANVALPMGIDEMIHLAYAVRRERRHPSSRHASSGWPVWREAQSRAWFPIVASVLIVLPYLATLGNRSSKVR
ncbi:MAG: hypothetical protein HY645_08055 [Acidobacteria bacterium]|nr:hypothetical protein [Acidobacteriota bacterium]